MFRWYMLIYLWIILLNNIWFIYEKPNNFPAYMTTKWWKQLLIQNSNITSFFRFANKRVIYSDCKLSLAHARCTHLNQVIKSHNIIINMVDIVFSIYIHWKWSIYPKLINMRCAIKTCKHTIIATDDPSIRLILTCLTVIVF
jgi:hypothetical protein